MVSMIYSSLKAKLRQQKRQLPSPLPFQVIRDLKNLKLVVEEANELTVELRGRDDLSFKGRVLMDPLDNEDGSDRQRF